RARSRGFLGHGADDLTRWNRKQITALGECDFNIGMLRRDYGVHAGYMLRYQHHFGMLVCNDRRAAKREGANGPGGSPCACGLVWFLVFGIAAPRARLSSCRRECHQLARRRRLGNITILARRTVAMIDA